MQLLLERKWKKDTYTIGRLYINGEFFSNTLEDKDRELLNSMPLEEIKEKKKAGTTAIPAGTYNIRMDIVSPRFKVLSWYFTNCHQGRMPRLEGVPGFEGILIHPGNTAKDTEGCILVGKNDAKGMVTKSKDYFLKLYNLMHEAYIKGEKIEIKVVS